MRAIIQRVTRASVTVNGGEPRAIGPGLVILLGVRDTDDIAIVPKLAEKCAHLRIFEDENGKLNRSAVELGYSALVVSNFTLYGDTAKGKRPSFPNCLDFIGSAFSIYLNNSGEKLGIPLKCSFSPSVRVSPILKVPVSCKPMISPG